MHTTIGSSGGGANHTHSAYGPVLRNRHFIGWCTVRGSGVVESWGDGEGPLFWIVGLVRDMTAKCPDKMFWYEEVD